MKKIVITLILLIPILLIISYIIIDYNSYGFIGERVVCAQEAKNDIDLNETSIYKIIFNKKRRVHINKYIYNKGEEEYLDKYYDLDKRKDTLKVDYPGKQVSVKRKGNVITETIIDKNPYENNSVAYSKKYEISIWEGMGYKCKISFTNN